VGADLRTAVTVVIATRDREHELRRSLDQLLRLPEGPEIIVVDNRSSGAHPPGPLGGESRVRIIGLPANLGAAARTVGARLATTRFVAFCDDDAWWEPGSLAAAADRLDADPQIGLVAARILVGPEATLDPTSELMGRGRLDEWLRPSTAGPRGVTGFLACAAMVRRSAFLAVGGFEPHLHIGAEEELAALDLADAGWKLVYLPQAVVRHFPSDRRDVAARQRMLGRNPILVAAMRYSGGGIAARVGELARRHPTAVGRSARDGLASAAWAMTRRRPVAPEIEAAFLGPRDTDRTGRTVGRPVRDA
jgi:GT2 family glycosyltransferase